MFLAALDLFGVESTGLALNIATELIHCFRALGKGGATIQGLERMALNQKKAKGRSNTKQFVMLYQDILWHPNYLKMSNRARALQNDLFAFYNGSNNGDLSACKSLMEDRGWASGSNLNFALKELIYYEFVVVSRQGGRNRPTLLALTCFPIDECGGKHDLRPTVVAPNNWKTTKKEFDPNKNPSPSVG